MTETRTNRHGLPQWSSGTDSGSRADFNEAFDKLNDQAAYDDGVDAAGLPVTGLTPGRYAMAIVAGDYRTLYRRSAGATWDAIGGNTMPRAFHHRALEGQARTDTAVTYSHPGSANPGATFDYGGSAVLSGTVRVYDDDEPTRGALMVGTALTADPATLGRVHVRTRVDGEPGLVIQPHGDGAGPSLAVRSSGGTNVFTVDSLGRVQQRGASAFGGSALSASSTVAISPTSSGSDDFANGLLLHGQSTATDKTIMRIQPDGAGGGDVDPIGLVTRTGMAWGRLPWGTPGIDGTMTLAGNSVYVRTSGHADNTAYFSVRRSNPTAEADPTEDVNLLTMAPEGASIRLPLSVTQRYKQDQPTLALYRVGNFTQAFQTLSRLVPGVGGIETAQPAGTWHSDGKISAGAWWKSTGTLRDARQSVHHLSTKIYAAPGATPTSGELVTTNNYFEYTFPEMTSRSATAFDIEILAMVELMLSQSGSIDGQAYGLNAYVSVAGGAFDFVAVQETAQASTPAGTRPTGDVMTCTFRKADIPSGSKFQVRLRLQVGAAAPSVYLRRFDINVEEALFEIYATT